MKHQLEVQAEVASGRYQPMKKQKKADKASAAAAGAAAAGAAADEDDLYVAATQKRRKNERKRPDLKKSVPQAEASVKGNSMSMGNNTSSSSANNTTFFNNRSEVRARNGNRPSRPSNISPPFSVQVNTSSNNVTPQEIRLKELRAKALKREETKSRAARCLWATLTDAEAMGELSNVTLARLLRAMALHAPAWRKDHHGDKGITPEDLLYSARETLFKETPQYQRNFAQGGLTRTGLTFSTP